ncbi:MAG: succinyl-diaminopimelate desuccinylase, partial [Pseudomonadota bacterium]
LPPSLTRLKADDKKLIEFTQDLLRIPSLTPIDKSDLQAARQSLDLIEDFVKGTGAEVHRMSFSGGHEKWDYEVDNLYVEWVIGKPEKHLCYIGHTDVVPTGPEQNWSRAPFSGQIKDGYVHGRGATDMKGSVTAFTAAVKALTEKSHNEDVNLRIGILLTTDEEWAAVNGTRKVLDWLQKNGKNPDAFIVGEPSSHDEVGSHVKLGRRGSLCGTFNVAGVQGHAAYTELFENPNRALALAISILNSESWHDGNEYFPNTNFETIALDSGNFNATAVVPGQATALWNIRFTHQQTPEGLYEHIKERLKNPPEWAKQHPDADKLDKIEVVANIDTASKPYYSPPGLLAGAAAKAIKAIKGALPKLNGSGGTTDGRFVHQYFPKAEIIELGLPERGGTHHCGAPDDYLKKGGMHQIDERASLSDLIALRDIFAKTLVHYNGQQDDRKPRPKKTRAPDHRS